MRRNPLFREPHRRRWRITLRLISLALLLLIVFLLWLNANLQAVLVAVVPGLAVEPTAGPLPPVPTLMAPRGALPAGHAGLEEWAHYADGAGRVGSGFLLRLDSGGVIGVTTAHSLVLSGWVGRRLETLTFRLPQAADEIAVFRRFHGPPGQVFAGYDFARDYVLLVPDEPTAEALALTPDPRGAPVPGERVVLSSGLGDGLGNPRPLTGTVTTVSAAAVWVQMDELFEAGGMSGSPLLSAHTGQVVGMAVSGGHNAPLLIGFHPIASLVAKARQADDFPSLATYRP